MVGYNVTIKREVPMSIQYKVDILTELKRAGYSTYHIRKNKLLGEAVLQNIREQKLISWENINVICRLLDCQPGDIIEYIPSSEEV